MKYDKLLYGKDQTEHITSIEVENEKAYLFIEKPNGDKDIKIVQNRFWILSPTNFDGSWHRMLGNLHFKYGKQFTDRQEFEKLRQKLYPRGIYTIKNPKESIMVKDGYTSFKGSKPNEVSVLSFDIETTGLVHDETSEVLLISNTFRSATGEITKKLFAYDEHDSVGDMIEAWDKWVQEVDPSILIAHNGFGFDIPYLKYVAEKYNKVLNLGKGDKPLEIEKWESKFRVDGSRDLHYKKCRIWGREIIDTMFLAYRYDVGRKYTSYGLKNMISQEKLEKPGRVFYDAGQIRFKYKDPEEWEKIKAYCVDDSDDALSLYDLMIAPFFYMCQSVAKPFQMMFESATGSQINTIMMRAYLQDRHSLPAASEAIEYEGAISRGNPGIFRNVHKSDVASLYPSIMIQYEVCDTEKDPQEYFKKLVSSFTEKRLYHKSLAKEDKYHDDMQGALKIFINSCYGFLGTAGILFNSPKLAAFVTEKGREILTGAIAWSEQNNYDLVNCDTDSVAICRKDQAPIEQDEKDFILAGLNAQTPDKISWEDDGFYPTFIVVKAKNYILWDGKKLKYKGSAIKATTKEPALQEFIKRIIDVLLIPEAIENTYEKCKLVYSDYVKEIMDIDNIIRWASKKTISDKILKNERTNESRVRDALEGSDYVEGDKIYVYFKEDGSLSLVENHKNDHDRKTLFKKLYKTSETFETILPIKELFTNYSLVKNYKILLDKQSVA